MAEKREMLVNVKTGKARPSMARPPVLTSASAPWQGTLLEQFSGGSAEMRDEAPVNHVIALQLARVSTVEWFGVSGSRQTRLAPGQVSLFPAMNPISARTFDTGDFLAVSVEPTFLRRAVHELARPERLELVPQHGVDDPLLRGLGEALQTEVAAGHPGGRWYGESLVNAMAVHLVRRYSAQLPAAGRADGGLGKQQLSRAIEFIHAHFADNPSLNAVATEAGLSPYHFARLFKQSTGLAPHQYLIRVRVDRAKTLLLQSESSITDIALQVGFCDQSHLATHFKRIYGLTPRAFLQQMPVKSQAV